MLLQLLEQGRESVLAFNVQGKGCRVGFLLNLGQGRVSEVGQRVIDTVAKFTTGEVHIVEMKATDFARMEQVISHCTAQDGILFMFPSDDALADTLRRMPEEGWAVARTR